VLTVLTVLMELTVLQEEQQDRLHQHLQH